MTEYNTMKYHQVFISTLCNRIAEMEEEMKEMKRELKETRETSQRMFNLFNFFTKNMYPDIDYYSDEESVGMPLTISDLDTEDDIAEDYSEYNDEDATEYNAEDNDVDNDVDNKIYPQYDDESNGNPFTISELDTAFIQYDDQSDENNSESSEEYPEPPKLVRQSNHPGFVPPPTNYYNLNLDDIVSGMERLSFNDNLDTTCGYGETHIPEFFQKINPLDIHEFVSDGRNYVGTDGIDYWDYKSQDSSRHM
jgi:hypothetical protein